jgi:hypothetical protein
MKKALKIIGTGVVVIAMGFIGLVAWFLYPHHELQKLPSPLIAATSTEGRARLGSAQAISDYESLANSYQAQSLASYCGVASSVSVLNALGVKTSQDEFFTENASQIRTQAEVMFGGMALPELAGLLGAYGLRVSVKHTDDVSLTGFRSAVKANLTNSNDYLLVNYQREVLGQGRVGHISPLAAYDEESDSVLIMDTAAHKYPPTWVPLELLHAAMQTVDQASGKMRGYVEVSNGKT